MRTMPWLHRVWGIRHLIKEAPIAEILGPKLRDIGTYVCGVKLAIADASERREHTCLIIEGKYLVQMGYLY